MKNIFYSILAVTLFISSATFVHAEHKISEVNPKLDKITTNISCVYSSVDSLMYCFGGRSVETGDTTDRILEVVTTTGFVGFSQAVMPEDVAALSCAEYEENGKIYCFGGTTVNGVSPYSDTIFEFSPQTGTLRTMESVLPTGRSGLSCDYSSSTKKIYCFGGFDGSYDKTKFRKGPYGVAYYPDSFNMIGAIIEYSPVTDSIKTMKAKMKTGVDDVSCVESSKNNLIYCFGGQYGDQLSNEIGVFDPVKDTYKTEKAKLKNKLDTTSCADNEKTGMIYCFGGSTTIDKDKYLSIIQEFNPLTGKLVKIKEKLPLKIAGHSCVSDNTGSIFCFGGPDNETIKFQ
jgi:N-acetylneuraminic acid mutarotase